MSFHVGSAMRIAPSQGALTTLETALASLRISQQKMPSVATTFQRHASHQAQGRANGAKDGPGKRLGAKKSAGEYVVTGNILFKQRGTLWFPGDNCFMGRDHTIHAAAPGYVRYYRDPVKHPKRKYIGVVFEKDQTLPQPVNSVRRRKLGMLAYQMSDTTKAQETKDSLGSTAGLAIDQLSPPTPFVGDRSNKAVAAASGSQEVKLTLRPGYMYRQANWEIGRAGERSKQAQMVPPFRPGDRFAAWRKTTLRKAKNAERRAMGRGGKKKK